MSVEANKQTALQALKAVGAGDADALGALMTPDATWWVLGKGPRDTAARPREPFLQALGGALTVFSGPVSFTIQGITAEGDRVAVEADSHADLRKGGTYDNMYHFLFLFAADGKIAAVREYNDTGYMRQAFA